MNRTMRTYMTTAMVISCRLLSTLPSFPSLPWKNSSQRGAALRKWAARRPVCPGTGAPPAGRVAGSASSKPDGTPTKLIRGQTRRQWPGRAGRKGRARGRKMQRAKKKPQGSWAGRRKHTWSAGVWCRVPTTAGGPHRHPPQAGRPPGQLVNFLRCPALALQWKAGPVGHLDSPPMESLERMRGARARRSRHRCRQDRTGGEVVPPSTNFPTEILSLPYRVFGPGLRADARR